MCYIIGLTGASGSGKGEAAKILAGFGATIIDADKISHEIFNGSHGKPKNGADGGEALAELAEAFGAWVVGGDGKLDRAAVAARAFSDRGFLGRLTEITHKYIIKEIYARVAALQSNKKNEIIVIDAPIPVEKGFLDLADAVWVVKASRENRLARIFARDGLSETAANARFSSQMADAEYERLADVIIENDSDVEELRRKITRILEKKYDNMQSGKEI